MSLLPWLDYWGVIALACVLVIYVLYYFTFVAPQPLVHYWDTPLNRFIEQTCTRLHSRYFPTPWILGGDFLTIFGIIFRRSYTYKKRREYVVNVDDNARLSLDWVEPLSSDSDRILLLLPGVTGHSSSPYLTHVTQEARNQGWRVVTMTYPGFDGESITSPRFMRVQDPSDLETVVNHIHATNPKSKIVIFGWSMGACLLVKYLGTVRENTPVVCGISACNPWCPFEARCVVAAKLHRRLLYNIHFRQAMVENFANNFDIFKEHLPHLEREHISKYFWMEDFDDEIMRPLSGSETLEEYYRSSGCLGYIRSVAVPLLVAHADDDPVVPHHMLPLDDIMGNSNVLFLQTAAGGHTGWLSGFNPRGASWFDHLALEWITQVLKFREDHESSPIRRSKTSRIANVDITSPGIRTRSMSKRSDSSQIETEATSPRSSRRPGLRERRKSKSTFDI